MRPAGIMNYVMTSRHQYKLARCELYCVGNLNRAIFSKFTTTPFILASPYLYIFSLFYKVVFKEVDLKSITGPLEILCHCSI